MSASTYPVHVGARLDPGLGRWQWLVKWLLVIPHYLVLALLWVAFAVLSLVAFAAILVTGRYPRAVFDFNVGVLRWTWRVAYYAYGALGTDRYPPFSLEERPDYPAHLEIDYPEHLSRGLVLVKWWLLAIPHYLVVGLFLGGAGYAAGSDSPPAEPWVWTSGLIGLMVLIAAVSLLFTGRYPQSVFDFVLGMNRWVLRVAAYAALMTDQYPPFRLDQGGDDPATPVLGRNTPAVGGGRWTAGRVVGVVAASMVAVASLGIGMGGVALLAADRGLRDDAGFLTSRDVPLATGTYALTSEPLQLTGDGPLELMPAAWLGEVRVTVESTTPVFAGIGATDDVAGYLGGVRREMVADLGARPDYRLLGDRAPEGPPAAQDFWVVRSSGAGERSLTWEVENGEWTIVMMNADATAGIDARVAAGAQVPALSWLAPTLLVVGGLGVLAAAVTLTLVVRGAGRR